MSKSPMKPLVPDAGIVERASRLLFSRQPGNRDGRPTSGCFPPASARTERDTGFPACEPDQSTVEAASRRLFVESKRQDAASTSCQPVPLFALASKSQRSTSIAPVIRSSVSMAGSRSRFSTRETIISPDRKATSFNESFRRSPRSNSINRTASRSDAFDTPAFYAMEICRDNARRA